MIPIRNRRTPLVAAVVVLLLAGLVAIRWTARDGGRSREVARRAPVGVAEVEHGPIVLRRTFTGTLEATSSFVVAPKVAGRINAINLDISDPVRRGQVVAQLDDAEYVQDVAQAEADLAVAQANLAEARSLAEIAEREIRRLNNLRDSGFTSESQFEAAEAERLAREAQLKVTQAQLTRAESSLTSARIRLGYTRVVANWDGAGDERIVAERFVDEGDSLPANGALLRVVAIDRVVAVIFVTEKEYARLHPGQEATLVTDAYPGEVFSGAIERIAPVFREATRQARVELLVPNADNRLKPGMFVRVLLTLDRVEDATIVPEAAITRRSDTEGVFLVDEAGGMVRWVRVQTGLRDGRRVQILDAELNGRVVVLGQQLIDDGSPVTIPEAGHRLSGR